MKYNKIKLLLIIVLIGYFVFSIPLIMGNESSNIILENEKGTLLNSFPEPIIDVNYINDNIIDDSPATAINISPSNYNQLDLYQSNIFGKLECDSLAIDYDYYYFKIYEDSYVSIISFGNSTIYPYELFILENVYSSISENKAYHSAENIYSNSSSEGIKCFNGYLCPGTYYIVLRGSEDGDYEFDYNLKLYVEKSNEYSSYRLDKLVLHEDLQGVVWKSDFIPFNGVHLTERHSDVIYYDENTLGIDIPDYFMDDVYNFTNGETVMILDYYIWGPPLQYLLYQILSGIYDLLKDELITVQNLRENTIIVLDKVEGYIRFFITIAGVTILREFEIPDSILSFITINFIKGIVYSNLPEHDYELIEYMLYLSSLKAMLFSSSGGPNYSTKAPGAVVRIPVFYKMSKDDSNPLDVKYKLNSQFHYHIIDKTTTLDNDMLKLIIDDNMATNDNNILNFNPDYSHNFRGKFYSLRSGENDLMFEYGGMNSIHDYNSNYTFVNQNEHTAFCICGKPQKQGHIVLKGSTKCILCGGNVNFGFIVGMANEYGDNNYTCSNGVVIIDPKNLHLIS